MATITVNTHYFGIEGWRKALKSAGKYLIDNADELVQEGERCREISVSLRGLSPDGFPILSIEKDYNVLEMMDRDFLRGMESVED